MKSNIGLYAKALNATVILVLGVFVTAYTSDTGVTMVTWVMAGVALLRGALAFGVRPEWGKYGIYVPLILTALIAALTQLITALQDGTGLGTPDILSILVVFFTSIGSSYATPNAKRSDALKSLPNAA